MSERPRTAIILAAGQGSRMKSDLAKPLHCIGGRSMLDWSFELANQVGVSGKVVVWGAHAPQIRDHADALGAKTVLQDPPQGTADAVKRARDQLADFEGDVIVLYADTPLIRPETIDRVFDTLSRSVSLAVLGFEPDDPASYGRLIENSEGDLDAIVEAKDASAEQLAIGFCNSGVLACSSKLLFELLDQVKNDNAKGEFYLTDIVALARQAGHKAKAVRADANEVLGVNDRADLAAAEAEFQAYSRQTLMASGVTLSAPHTVFTSYDTQIGTDVIVEPHVVFGPGVKIHSGARIRAFSHLENCVVGANCEVGPYARLRPGTQLDQGAKIGNFVEVKNARIGEGAKANHLSYIGDADIGKKANIGAGTITCNYDGFFKHKTHIGDGAFIGSNSSLVAPVTIGDGAMTGSGAVVTADVPADALALARAKQDNKTGWAARFRKAMSRKKNKPAS